MRIAVTGSSGLIGTALREALRADGHDLLRLVRRNPEAQGEVHWDPGRGEIDLEALKGVDGVVNLAGAGTGDRRWTDEYKQVIRDSRLDSTRTIAEALATLDPRPAVLVSASGVNYYGSDHGDRSLDERDPSGSGFLSGVCRDWEAATSAAGAAGVRVCHVRTGLVMSRRGGALPRMLPFFRLGIGGPLGSGAQYWSHVSLVDVVRAIRFLLVDGACSGPYNLTAPEPVTNREFTRELGRALHRPTLLPVPSLALRVYIGEFSQHALGSLRVLPRRLLEAGFVHQHPDAESVVRAALA